MYYQGHRCDFLLLTLSRFHKGSAVSIVFIVNTFFSHWTGNVGVV